jgi:ribosomal protein S3AE
MILKHIRRVDTVQDLKTKDGAAVRVKGLGITSRRIKSTIRVKVRNQMKATIKKEVENLTMEEFVKKVVSDELKNRVLGEARRIYPVRNFLIRKIEVVS